MKFKSIEFKRYSAIEFAHIDLTKQATIVVGRNGSGKTTLLSVLFDALVSLKQARYNEIAEAEKNKLIRPVRMSTAMHHSGAATVVVDLEIEGESRKFVEVIDGRNNRTYPNDIPRPSAQNVTSFEKNGLFKGFIPDAMPESYLTSPHVIAFYPAGRAERPSWLGGNIAPNFNLEKTYIDTDPYSIWRSSVVEGISAWILNVILDAELYDVRSEILTLEGGITRSIRVNINGRNRKIVNHLNRILSLIIKGGDRGYEKARLVVTQRQKGVRSVSVYATKIKEGGEVPVALDLNSLSSGELALFTVFADIIQLAERTGWSGAELSEISGVVLIDELDVHLHVTLQLEIVQELFRVFSGIQFIATGHSPFMLMGINEEHCSIVSMPSGKVIPPSQYSEFQHAYERFNEHGRTREAALSAVIEALKAGAKPLIATEGKTDIDHIQLAISELVAAGKIEPIDVRFIDKTRISGDDDLMRLFDSACKLDLDFPLICIFDRDNPKYVSRIEASKEFLAEGTCAAMCIATPAHRAKEEPISIEHLYQDMDFFRTLEDSQKRLRVYGEIRRTADGKRAFVVEDGDLTDMRIFDIDVSKIGDAKGGKHGDLAISKSAFFTEVVCNNRAEIDFTGFIPTIEKIRTILASLAKS